MKTKNNLAIKLDVPTSISRQPIAVDDPILVNAIAGIDQTDRINFYAVREYVEQYQKEMKESIEDEDVILQVQHQEVIAAAVKCHRLLIELLAEKRRVKLIEEKYNVAKQQLVQGINEFEDVDPDIEWKLDLNRLLVLRRKMSRVEFASILLKFCQDLCGNEDGTVLKSVEDKKLPGEIQELVDKKPEIMEFISDFVEFLLKNGEKGRALVMGICRNTALAKKVSQDEELPKPARFLAVLSMTASKEDQE